MCQTASVGDDVQVEGRQLSRVANIDRLIHRLHGSACSPEHICDSQLTNNPCLAQCPLKCQWCPCASARLSSNMCMGASSCSLHNVFNVIDSGQHQTCLPHVASDPQQIRCRCMQAQEVALTLPSKRSIDIERCVSQLVVWLQRFVTVTNELCLLCDDSDPSVNRARPVSIQTCLQRFWQSYCQSKSWKALVKPRITKTHVVQMKPFPQSPPPPLGLCRLMPFLLRFLCFSAPFSSQPNPR